MKTAAFMFFCFCVFSLPVHAEDARSRLRAVEKATETDESGSVDSALTFEKLFDGFEDVFQKKPQNIVGAEQTTGDIITAFIEIYYGGKSFLVTYDDTFVGGHKMKLVNRAFGILLVVDGVSRAIISSIDREPTIFPLVTYSLAKAGVIDAPSKFEPSSKKVRQAESIFAIKADMFLGAFEILAAGVMSMTTMAQAEQIGKSIIISSNVASAGGRGILMRGFVRFAPALLLVDGVLRLAADSLRADASLLPLLRFADQKINDQFNYKRAGRIANQPR